MAKKLAKTPAAKERPYFGILSKYIKPGMTPWTRELDGDATGAAWAQEAFPEKMTRAQKKRNG
jgi:hypothetical protein